MIFSGVPNPAPMLLLNDSTGISKSFALRFNFSSASDIADKIPGGLYNYMWELHGSPNQRLMIAEINKFYNVDLIVMDAMKAFINQGPERGETVESNLILASKDRVAIDGWSGNS